MSLVWINLSFSSLTIKFDGNSPRVRHLATRGLSKVLRLARVRKFPRAIRRALPVEPSLLDAFSCRELPQNFPRLPIGGAGFLKGRVC